MAFICKDELKRMIEEQQPSTYEELDSLIDDVPVLDLERLIEDKVAEERNRHFDLYIRDKYSGNIHRIGDDCHDCLTVDEQGTVQYNNYQNGDGCYGYASVNKTTLKDAYPEKEWGDRASEYVYGYEFVPNEDENGFPINPMEKDDE